MIEVILVCSCSGMEKKAADTFSIVYPGHPIPKVYKGKDKVRALSEQHPGTNLARYVQGVSKKAGRWAYYLVADEQGDITLLYDLITNARVA